MPITTPRELCVSMLSELRHGSERSQKIYQELGNAAQNPEIKEALDARELVSSQIISRLVTSVFQTLLGRNRLRSITGLHDVFIEEVFARNFSEIQGRSPANSLSWQGPDHLAHLTGTGDRLASYRSDRGVGCAPRHPGVGVLLEELLGGQTLVHGTDEKNDRRVSSHFGKSARTLRAA